MPFICLFQFFLRVVSTAVCFKDDNQWPILRFDGFISHDFAVDLRSIVPIIKYRKMRQPFDDPCNDKYKVIHDGKIGNALIACSEVFILMAQAAVCLK